MRFDMANIVFTIPEMIVFSAACLLLLVDLFLRKEQKHIIGYVAIGVVIMASIATLMLTGETVHIFSKMLVVDSFATFFKTVFYITTLLTILLSINYIKIEDIEHSEYYILLLFALTGMMIMASGANLLSIYVGLELMALSIYVLTGFMQRSIRSNEAAMKYVILGGFSSGVLLYGISLIYGLTGTTQLSELATVFRSRTSLDLGLVLAIIFLIAGFGFKVAAVPFHMWAPDVYEGAPTSITAFMSVGPKAASFAAILRVFLLALGPVSTSWVFPLEVLAVVTMAVGSIVALVQTNIKRMLAYSSIAHAGYVLLGLVAGGPDGIAAVMLYMLIYTFMNLGIFGTIILMRRENFLGEDIEEYAGLSNYHRGAALLMLIFLFSLAGIPPTAGFVGKFYIFMALINKGLVSLAVIAVIISAISAYFYIRIVMMIYMREPAHNFKLARTPALSLALGIAAAGTVLIGILPSWFLELAKNAILNI